MRKRSAGLTDDHHHHHHQSCSNSSSIDSNYTNSALDDDHRDYHDNGDYSSLTSSGSCSSSSMPRSSNVAAGSTYGSKDLSTDLRLGLTISPLPHHQHPDLSSSYSPTRGQYSDWPPIKPLLRSTLAEKSFVNTNSRPRENTLFVKVYMEGIPIGRKLDLLALDGYHSMIATLSHMFNTTILYPNNIQYGSSSENCHILTYEDKEGDWMMVGDVPWEMFLTTVRRLKIATSDKCQ